MQLKAPPDIGAFAAMEFSTFKLKQGISEATLLAAVEQMVEGGVSVNSPASTLPWRVTARASTTCCCCCRMRPIHRPHSRSSGCAQFKRPQIAGRHAVTSAVDRTREATLVMVKAIADGGIQRRAARQQGVGLGRAAVVAVEE